MTAAAPPPAVVLGLAMEYPPEHFRHSQADICEAVRSRGHSNQFILLWLITTIRRAESSHDDASLKYSAAYAKRQTARAAFGPAPD